MPQLKQFSADINQAQISGGRRADASDFATLPASVGQGLMELGKSIKDEEERDDVLNSYTELAETRKRAVEKMDEMRQKGLPMARDFGDYLNDELSKVAGNRTTRRGIAITRQHAATMSSELGHTARLADAQIASDNAKQRAKALIDANGTVLQRDPSLLESTINEQSEYVSLLPGLTPQQRNELTTTLTQEAAKNAVRGWIDTFPQVALEGLQKGRWDKYLDSDSKAALTGAAEREIRSLDEQRRAAEAEARLQHRMNADQIMNNALVGVYEGKFTAKDVAALAKDQKITPDQTSHLYSLIEQRARAGGIVRSDLRTVVDVITRLQDNAISQGELNTLALGGRLSQDDYKRFSSFVLEGNTALKQVRKDISGRVDQAFFGVFPGLPINAEQSQAKASFDALIRDREKEYRNAKKDPMDYYTSGEYEKDARNLAPKRGVLGGAADVRAAIEADVEAQKPMMFPDGRKRVWNGKGLKTDMKNWVLHEGGATGRF